MVAALIEAYNTALFTPEMSFDLNLPPPALGARSVVHQPKGGC